MKTSASFITKNMEKNHSSDDLQEEGTGDEIPKMHFVFRTFLFKDAKFSKLMTREDPHHIHKTLGALAVFSFIYRYSVCFLTNGNLGFDGMDPSRDKRLVAFDWITMIVHTALALSSILFRVPKWRITTKPMVIYEEYRQHAMVFTLRCFFVFFVTYLFPQAPAYTVPAVVMAHHLLADRVTAIWGTPGNTAVRATSENLKLSGFYLVVSKVYSLYQFLAIASHILPNARLGDMAFNAIIAIQSSAFMMTLYRKRIIRGSTHMVVYALCLVMSAYHIVRSIGLVTTGLVIVAFMIRIHLPRDFSDKYAIWTLFAIVMNRDYFLSFITSAHGAILAGTSVPDLMLDPSIKEAVKGSAMVGLVFSFFKLERLVFGTTASKKPEVQESDKDHDHED